MPPLNNARHEKFVQGLLEGKPAAQAYTDAGYKPDDGNASRLHASKKVQDRLAELQCEVAQETKVTVESLLKELEEARAKATDLKQLSAAVRAVEAKAKVSGLLVQKVEVGGPDDFSSAETNEQVIDALLRNSLHAPFQSATEGDRQELLALSKQYQDQMWKIIDGIKARCIDGQKPILINGPVTR